MPRRFALMLILFSPALAGAQSRDTTSVPRELAAALLRITGYGDAEPRIVVGSTPSDFPRELLPTGGTVLGAIDYGDSGEMRASRPDIVVIRRPESPDSAMAVLRAHLDRAGWRAPAYPEMQMSGGGFTPAYFDAGQRLALCRDSASVTGSVMRRAEGGSLVQISHRRGDRNTICDDRRRQMMMDRMPPGQIQLPTLRLPAGARGGSTGTGGGMDYRESNARIETAMSPADLLGHFSAQLTAEGWTLVQRLAEGNAAVLTARKSDTAGRVLYGTLVVTRLEGDARDALFRVVTPTRDRR